MITKYDIAANLMIENLDKFHGVMSANIQRKVFGRYIFGKKTIKIDCENQGKVTGSFKACFGLDFVTFSKSFEEIARLANDPSLLLTF